MWQTVERPGQSGFKKDELAAEWTRKYGKWRKMWTLNGETVDRLTIFKMCEEAYYADSINREEIWKKLCKDAKDVYDMLPEETESGTDYTIQHKYKRFHDIAIRRVIQRRGWKFEGDKIIQIRWDNSPDWYSQNFDPGKVPFHRLELIIKPILKGWWDPNSIECFYQSNKVLQAHDPTQT